VTVPPLPTFNHLHRRQTGRASEFRLWRSLNVEIHIHAFAGRTPSYRPCLAVLPIGLTPHCADTSFTMRTTLRRSCDACAKAKHGCDLKTPKCSRCLRRNVPCVYANAPAASLAPNTSPTTHDGSLARIGSRDQWSTPSPVLSASARTTPEVFDQSAGLLIGNVDSSFDPFDSYPATRVPRPQIQRLIHHCSFTILLSI
jgi:hypothetical protein